MGSIIEELPHNLAPCPRIAAALHLDEGRDAFLVQEEMIERPTGTRIIRNAHLTGDEEPTPWRLWINLVAWEQTRMTGEELLEIHFGSKSRLGHLSEAAVGVEKKDASSHGLAP
jgi:hypothetical protein